MPRRGGGAGAPDRAARRPRGRAVHHRRRAARRARDGGQHARAEGRRGCPRRDACCSSRPSACSRCPRWIPMRPRRPTMLRPHSTASRAARGAWRPAASRSRSRCSRRRPCSRRAGATGAGRRASSCRAGRRCASPPTRWRSAGVIRQRDRVPALCDAAAVATARSARARMSSAAAWSWGDVLADLQGGKGIERAITIPEGWSLAQIVPQLARVLGDAGGFGAGRGARHRAAPRARHPDADARGLPLPRHLRLRRGHDARAGRARDGGALPAGVAAGVGRSGSPSRR